MTVRELRRSLKEKERGAGDLRAAMVKMARAAVFIGPLMAAKCPEAAPQAMMASDAAWQILRENGIDFFVSEDGPGFACVACEAVSFSRKDAEERYCAICSRFYPEEVTR